METDSWFPGGSIPSHRFRFTAAAHGDSIYLFGGQGALIGSHNAAGSAVSAERRGVHFGTSPTKPENAIKLRNQMVGNHQAKGSFPSLSQGSESFQETIKNPGETDSVLKRTMVEKNGEPTPRSIRGTPLPGV